MALYLEQTLYNADVVRYHRIGAYFLDPATSTATCVLESYRTKDQRALSIQPLIKREFPFVRSGDPNTLAAEAYAAIMALPEWSDAETC